MDIQEKAKEALTLCRMVGAVCDMDRVDMTAHTETTWLRRAAAAELVRDLPPALEDAEIVLWTKEMYSAAMRGAREAMSGTHVPSLIEEIKRPQFWFLVDGNFGMPDSEQEWSLELPPNCDCQQAILLPAVEGGDRSKWLAGVMVYFDEFDSSSFDSSNLPYLRRTSVMRPGEQLRGGDYLFLACLQFMNLRLAAKEPVKLPRPDRRRMQCEGRPIPEINVIQLRRREPSGWHSATEREYHHQWIVKGHWRRLHEPRKKDGAQVTFVESYVKGPEGAPLLPPRETVFAVTR